MQRTSQLRGVTLVLSLIVTLVGAASPASAATEVIRPTSMGPWEVNNYDSSTVPPGSSGDEETEGRAHSTFVSGPSGVPIGIGSVRQVVGDAGGDQTRLRTGRYNGLSPSGLTDFSYSTRVFANTSGEASYVVLAIDKDADGSFVLPLDEFLVFEPKYQTGGYPGAVVPNQCPGIPACVDNAAWQTWDVDAGGFWVTNAFPILTTVGPPLVTLAGYAAANPGAVLATDVPSLWVASGGGDNWIDFAGHFDNLSLNGTTYDFEPVPLVPPTVTIVNGGDGYLNAADVAAGVNVVGGYAHNPLLDTIEVRIVASATCDPLATSTPTILATLGGGSYTAGPFDLSSDLDFPQGGRVCAIAKATESSTGRTSPNGVSAIRPIKDTLAPPAPTVNISPDPIGLTTQSSVTISGTAEALSRVSGTLADAGSGSVSFGPVFADGAGSWSVAVNATPLADGTVTATATSADAAGNVSGPGTDTAVKDTTPIATIDLQDGDGYVNAAEAAAGVPMAWEVQGSGPNVTISIYNTGNPAPGPCVFTNRPRGPTTGAVPASCFAALSEGAIEVLVEGTAGGSPISDTDSSILDRIAPAAPTVSIDTDPITAGNQTMTLLSGTAESGANVAGTLTDSASGSVSFGPVASTGTWSATTDATPLADGTITATAQATDAAGNVSPSATDTAVKDTSPPGATIAWNDGDGFVNASEAAAGVPVTWNVPGTGPNVDVTVNSTGSPVPASCSFPGQARSGSLSVPASCFTDLVEGQIEAHVDGMDSMSNPQSAVDVSTLDRIAPAAPTATISPDPIGVATQTAVEVAGGAESGSTVDVSITDGISTLMDQSPSNGSYAVTFDLTSFVDGIVTATATATDEAGNSSGSANDTATLDRVAPAAPTVSIDTDPITAVNQTATTLSGTAEPGSEVNGALTDIGTGSVSFGPAPVDGAGNWSAVVDATSLSDGTVTATATATDAAGNESAPASDTAIKESGGPVAGTVFIDDGDGYMNAAETASGIPATWENTAAGADAVAAEVWFEDSASNIPVGCGPFAVGPSGVGSVNPTCAANLPEGQFFFKGRWFDAAANPSVVAIDSSIKDTIAPAAGTIDFLDLDGFVNDDEAFNGVATVYSAPETGPTTVAVENTGLGAPAACTFSGLARTGSMVVTPACFDALNDGPLTISLLATDPAGNLAPTPPDTSELNRTEAALFFVDDTNISAARIDSAGRDETDDGRSLKVRVELNSQVLSSVVGSVTVRDSLGNELTSPERVVSINHPNTRVFSFDVTGFANGPVTAEGDFRTTDGAVPTNDDETFLDLDVPTGSWTTLDGAAFVRLNLGFLVLTTGALEGDASDPTSPIQYVYVTGRNVDDPNQKYAEHCAIPDDPALSVVFECGIQAMPAGTWEVKFRVQDEVGNVFDGPTIEVVVIGTPF